MTTNDRPPVIDIHTHVFNARYLPLEGIFLSFMHDPSWLTRKLVRGVTTLIEESTGTSYDSGVASLSPLPLSKQLFDEVGGRIVVEFEARVRGTQAASRSAGAVDTSGYVTDRLADDPLVQALAEVEQVMTAMTVQPSEQWQLLGPDTNAVATRLATLDLAASVAMLDVEDVFDDIVRRLKRAVLWGLEKLWSLFDTALRWWETLEEFLTFVLRMLMAEREILSALSDAYNDLGNVTFLHLMMDMQFAYDPPKAPRYQFDEQVRRMRRLSGDSDGALLGFAAFDPRRPDEFSLPEGFLGAKFYPAMGYRPAENDDRNLQAAVDNFFGACVVSDTPIFTHCTPKGFETRRGAGVNAHPKYWAGALNRYPRLRLCLGHAGGGRMSNGDLASPGWFAKDDDEWSSPDNFAARVVDLCRRYEHVYCEFGHLDGVLGDDAPDRHAFETNLVREWKSTEGPYPFATKCMFGSDHHMPKMINRAADLLEYFRGLFARHRLDGFSDFCGGNARNYLKLTP